MVTADAKSKVEGNSDPALTYQSEAQGVNRGLMAGDVLVGALTRVTGETAGNYAIQQGTVTDTNNSNYAINYVAADLTISTVQTPTPTPPDSPVVIPPVIDASPLRPGTGSPNPLFNVNPALVISLAGSGDGAAAGILISLNTAASGNANDAAQNSVVTVSVPKAMATSGTGFGFDLPVQVRESLGTDAIQVTLADGSPLPRWIQFNPVTLRFEAGAVPDGGLPLQIMLRTGKRQVLIVISERTE
jgi:hypothetical protein